MRIFLSAVSGQFREARDALASDLRAVGAEVVVQEDFQQHGRTLLQKLEEYIASCDRVIVLIGDGYGWEPATSTVPGAPRRSYSQWEYFFAQGERLAGERQAAIDAYVYFASADFLTSNPVAQEPDAALRQQSFVKDVRESDKDWNEFGSVAELRAVVLRDGFRLPEQIRAELIQSPVSLPPPELLLEYSKQLQAGTIKQLFPNRMAVRKPNRRENAEPAQLAALDQILDENERTVLVGEGGLGKTMALRQRERKLAMQYVSASTGRVPVLLRLAEYGGGRIEPFIANRITTVLKGSGTRLAETPEDSERVVQRWLEEGGQTVELMFDGLNETPEGHAQELHSELEGFLRYKQRFVFTGRDHEADLPLPGHDIPVFLLAPLTAEEVNEFLRHQLADGREELLSRVNSDRQFAELLQNPFFLDIIVELALRPGGRVPNHRALLIREYVAQVPRAVRQEGRVTRPANRAGVMDEFLKELGWNMLRSGVLGADYRTVYDWNLPRSGILLNEVLIGASVFRHLRSPGLDGELIEFRHPLLRDYFAAECICARMKKGNDLDWATEGQYNVAGWRDPIRMTAGLSGPDSAAIVTWLANKGSLNLAFDCWADSEAIDDPDVTKSLAAALRAHITSENIEWADTILVQLGELRDPDAVPLIREFMERVGYWAHFVAIPALASIRSAKALETLAEWLQHEDEDTRRLAAKNLRKIGGDAIPALLRSPSGTAETILGELAPAESVKLTAALVDSDGEIRGRAVWALGASGDPNAAIPISAVIGNDRDSEILVRTKAAIALGKLGNPVAVPALTNALKTEENPGVRFEAASALWENGWAIKEARAALFEMYETLGTHSNWKQQILKCMMKRPDKEILAEAFKACRDGNGNVRYSAFLLVRNLSDDQAPENVDDLLSEGLRDSSDAVRTVAAGELFSRHQSEALGWLIKAFDEDPVGNAGILNQIGENYGVSGREFLIRVLNSDINQKIRAGAAKHLRGFSGEETRIALTSALEKGDPVTEADLVLDLIRGLRSSTDPQVIARLRSIVEDKSAPEAVRFWAAEGDDRPSES